MNDAAPTTRDYMNAIARNMLRGPRGLRMAHSLAVGLLDEPLYGNERPRVERLVRGIERRLAR